jgi:hypothetical protein
VHLYETQHLIGVAVTIWQLVNRKPRSCPACTAARTGACRKCGSCCPRRSSAVAVKPRLTTKNLCVPLHQHTAQRNCSPGSTRFNRCPEAATPPWRISSGCAELGSNPELGAEKKATRDGCGLCGHHGNQLHQRHHRQLRVPAPQIPQRRRSNAHHAPGTKQCIGATRRQARTHHDAQSTVTHLL